MRRPPVALVLAFLLLPLLLLPQVWGASYPLVLIIGVRYPGAELNVDKEHVLVIRGSNCSASLRARPKTHAGGVLLFDSVEVIAATASVELYRLAAVAFLSVDDGSPVEVHDVVGYRADCTGETRVYVAGAEIVGARVVVFTIKDERDAQMYGVQKIGESGGLESALGSIWEFLSSTFSTFVQTVVTGVRSIGEIVGGGIGVLSRVLGKPGDPMAQLYAAQYKLALLQYLNSPIRDDVEAVLNCTKPLREVMGLIPMLREEDADKTICQVEDSSPQGIVGLMSTAWTVIAMSGKVLELVARYFVVINAAVFTAILAWGGAASIKRRDPEPLVNAIKMIYGILKFYFNIGVFLLNLGLKFVEAIAQAINALISVAQALTNVLKSAIDWLLGLFRR